MRNVPTYVGDNRVLLRSKSGYKMYVDSRDVSIAPHLILEGVYEEHTDAALRRLVKPGMHAIEIGANVGLFTLLIAHIVGASGSVLAFECDPTLAQIVRDNLEINGFAAIGTVDERAVSDAEGTLSFFTAERHRGGGTLVAGLQQIPGLFASERRQIDVRATTLDVVLAERAQRVDFVKIDAEGAEAAILRGGRSLFADTARPLVATMEFAPKFMRESGSDPSAALDELAAWGFAFRRIDERKRRIVDAQRDDLLARDFSDIVLTRK